MNAMPEKLFTKVMELINRSSPNDAPMTRLEEQQLEILCHSYKHSKMLRAWVILSVEVFSRAVVERKNDIFIDGFLHLQKMILNGRR